MPEKKTIERAQRAKREGKSPSTQAGEFVREEIHHVREGKHGARSAKQAIAIGLSKARKAGVRIPRPKGGKRSRRSSARTAKPIRIATPGRPSAKRSRAVLDALRKEPHRAASHDALAAQAHRAAREKSQRERSAAARKAARTRTRD